MKKITSILIAAVAAFAAVMTPATASAQRGEKALGVMGGYATYNDGGYMNLYFQYSFANHFRIAPEIGYVFRNDCASAFIMSVDMHFPFRLAKAFSVYPLVGLTFNNWSYCDDSNQARVGGDFGAGFDFYLTSYLKLTLQGKYSLMNDTSGGFIGMGIGYVF